MKLRKNGIYFKMFNIRWGISGSTMNGNGTKNFHIFFSWLVGNGDDGSRCIK